MEYLLHLQKDKKLKKAIITPLAPLCCRKNVALALMRSIMGQQLSTKVGEVLFLRFLHLFGDKEPTTQRVLTLSIDTLRSIGLSRAKAGYILNVALFCQQNKITDRKLQKMENQEIIALLTQIKGVGTWTVEMLLMFTLGREDIFSLDDLGIQQSMTLLYGLDNTNKRAFREDLRRISDKWKPFRSYACMHLWQWKDNAPA